MNCLSGSPIWGLLALISIAIAIWIRKCPDPNKRILRGYILVGVWATGPPLWFIWEWHMFDFAHCKEQFEVFKYSQELARNVWVALVVLLGSIVKIKWGGASE